MRPDFSRFSFCLHGDGVRPAEYLVRSSKRPEIWPESWEFIIYVSFDVDVHPTPM